MKPYLLLICPGINKKMTDSRLKSAVLRKHGMIQCCHAPSTARTMETTGEGGSGRRELLNSVLDAADKRLETRVG